MQIRPYNDINPIWFNSLEGGITSPNSNRFCDSPIGQQIGFRQFDAPSLLGTEKDTMQENYGNMLYIITI